MPDAIESEHLPMTAMTTNRRQVETGFAVMVYAEMFGLCKPIVARLVWLHMVYSCEAPWMYCQIL